MQVGTCLTHSVHKLQKTEKDWSWSGVWLNKTGTAVAVHMVWEKHQLQFIAFWIVGDKPRAESSSMKSSRVGRTRVERQWVRAHQRGKRQLGADFKKFYWSDCNAQHNYEYEGWGDKLEGGMDKDVWQISEWRMQGDRQSTCKSAANLAAYNQIHPIYH